MDADCRRRAAAIRRSRRLAGLGSSDAHSEDVLGVCYTEFDAPIATAADLVAAIRDRRATARARDRGPRPAWESTADESAALALRAR